jgi:predicted dehydrogenase
LYAVASRSHQKASSFANQFNVPVSYGSYELLVKDPLVDAIYIATPHSFHKEHTILCLQHKKAVLCEKPFAMNLQEVKEMVRVAKKNNTLLMEALWTAFLPHFQYVKNSIKNKNFGKIIHLEADFGFKSTHSVESRVLKKDLGGGSLLDIGIYPVFAALSTLGVPKSIEADATFFTNGADSSCEMIFNYDNVKAILKSTFLKETPTEAVFTCEHGVIKINTRFHQPTTITLLQNGIEEHVDFSAKTFGYNFEIEHFNQLLRDHKKESDLMSFSFSKDLIATIDLIRKKINLNY